MMSFRRPDPALFAGVLLALAVSASAQSPPGEQRLADPTAGQTLVGAVTGGDSARDRASGATFGRLRRPASGRGSLLGDIARDYRTFFTTRSNYQILGLGLGTSLAVRPLDAPISTSRFNAELWQDTRLDHVFEGGELLGGALFQIGGAFATYGVGKVVGAPGLSELGRDLVRVQVLAQGVTHAIKYSVGRTRPDGSSNRSFPSGHSSGSFATATVLQRHYGWKVGIPAYGIASYIAASRLSENKHFLSDVAFGAVIGLTAGRTVMFDRGSTRFEVAPLVTPGGGGVRLTVFKR